jgi:hypothetical protein
MADAQRGLARGAGPPQDPAGLLSADIPSMGTMTARAAATVYAALLATPMRSTLSQPNGSQ